MIKLIVPYYFGDSFCLNANKRNLWNKNSLTARSTVTCLYVYTERERESERERSILSIYQSESLNTD